MAAIAAGITAAVAAASAAEMPSRFSTASRRWLSAPVKSYLARLAQVGLCVLPLLLGLVSPVAARPLRRAPADSEEVAREALQRGQAALQAGDLPTAQTALSTAYRTQPSPLSLYQLGRLAQAEGRVLDAYDLMRRFLADPELDVGAAAATANPTGPASGDAPPKPESELTLAIREAERVLASAVPPSGSLSIRGERGTLVFVDGRVVGSLPLPLPILVSPAEHKLALSRGTQRIEDQVQILAGRSGELRTDVTSGALVLSILPGVLLIEDWRELPEGVRPRLLQAVEKGLLSHRLSPLSRDFALQLSGTPQISGCLGEARCQIDLARKVDAGAVLDIRVRQNPAGAQLRVGLLDLEVGEEASADEQTCKSCTPEQLSSALVALVSRVYESGQGRTRATLQVKSEPSDVEILLDGKTVGRTPYQHVVFTGRHQLTLKKDTYQPEVRDVTLADGEQRQVEVQLTQPEPAPAALPKPPVLRRTPRPAWRIAVGSLMMAAGLVSAGFGIGAASINGACTQTAVSPGGECRELYSTGGLAAGLITTGLLVTGGGVVLMALPGRMRLVEAAP